MEPFLTLRKGKVWLDIGWFTDEPFKLFSITICKVPTNAYENVDFVILFDLQIIKFSVSFGLYL